MSELSQPANIVQGNYQPGVPMGGTLTGTPEPPEPFYPLRCDQFLTFRDGEMSEARSVRDACATAFVAAAVGIGGLVALIDWDASIKDQKVAIGATAILSIGAVAALVVGCIQHRGIKRARSRSAYSRLVATIEKRFDIAGEAAPASLLGGFLRFFRRD